MTKTRKILGLTILVMLTIVSAGVYWVHNWVISVEKACWKHEATEAFQRYGSFKTRSDILRAAAALEKDISSNSVEVIETDPNGCSFGSNGQTVLRFFFDDKNKLKTIKVFRNYIASDYKLDLIEERKV